MEVRGYSFGRYRLDVSGRQLLREGAPVQLPAKAFETLLLLVANHERAVTKDELMKAVWPDTFVSEDSLTQSISTLRRALADAEMIATIPRRGYRFIVPVTEDTDAPAIAPGARTDSHVYEPEAHAPAPRQRLRGGPITVALAVLGVALVGALVWFTRQANEPQRPLRFTQEAPPGVSIVSGGTLSPDGRVLAFVGEDQTSGATRLWVRPLASASARALEGTEDAARPFWSPDSQFLGFVANGRLKIVPATGGAVRTLATVRNNYAGGAAWGDDVIVFANWRGGLDAVRPSGAPVQAITSLDAAAQDASHQWPSFLADSHRFVFVVASSKPERAGIYVGSIDGETPRRILDGSHAVAVFAPPDHLLFVRNNTLMAQPLDSARAQLHGEPQTLADGVTSPDIRNSATVSAAAGGLVAFGGGTALRRLAWFDRRGTRLATIDAPGTLTNPTFSPDEKQLLAVSFDPELRGVWLLDLARGAPNRLVPDGTLPMPSPTGDTIAFASARNAGVFDMYLRRLDGPAGDEPLLQTNESKFVNDWSRDGRFIIFDSSNAKTGEDIWILPTFGDRRPVPYLRTEYNEVQSRISPNGRWVAYSSDESGIFDVYLQSFPTPGAKQIVSIRGGAEPVWRRDGRELYYLAVDRTLMAVDIEDNGSTLRVGRPRALFRAPVSGPLNVYRSHYAATADGQRFVIDAVDAPGARESISVLANWPALAGVTGEK